MEQDMSLRINDVAPDFEADTTAGRIRLHDWIGDCWAVLFSHPKDHVPRSANLATRIVTSLALGLVSLPAAAQPAASSQAGSVVCGGETTEVTAVERAARAYAAFWNSGDEALAHAALTPTFEDRTLPSGRPQGVEGVLAASRNFRAAVPDLRVELLGLIVAGEYAVVRYRFTGRFTGRFGEHSGAGQQVSFIAIDIYRVADGRIAENWHLEDNLTLLRQLGVLQE
jgi:predicted ester cyclase